MFPLRDLITKAAKQNLKIISMQCNLITNVH